jgi:hypothetical protein
MPVTKVPSKRIKKEIKTLRKGLAKEKKSRAKTDKTTAQKTDKLSTDMGKLKADLEKLGKKKASKKQLSEYNLFMRRQLNDGKTFAQAVRLWKAYKSGKPLVKTKVVKKTIVRNIKVPSKPRIKYRTRTVTKTVVKRAKPKVITKTVVKRAKPKVITRTRTIMKKIPAQAIERPVQKISESRILELIEKTRIKGADGMHLSDEELSVKLVSLYFEEIARMGFKRQLELDDVINAYYHALSKLKTRKIEASKEPVVVVQSQPMVVESKQ